MSYNSNLPEDIDITVSRADVRENLRALKEDKIVDAATAVTAESAAKLTTARTISLEGDATGSTSFDGSADVSITVDVTSADTAAQCTGNAATATKLETARNINGVAFDGSADITITVPTMPIGSVIIWPFSTLPGGDDEGKWLECNGQSTDDYPELAAIAGTTVPDFRNKFLEGSDEPGLDIEAGLPELAGTLSNVSTASTELVTANALNGVFQKASHDFYGGSASSGTYRNIGIKFSASKYNSIYGNSNTVQPPAITVKYLIKAK